MNTYMNLFLALAAGASAFFGLRAYFAFIAHSKLSKFDQFDMAAEEYRASRARRSLADRAKLWLLRQGYDGDPKPIALIIALFTAASTLVLEIIGMGLLLSLALSLPATVGLLLTVSTRISRAHHRRFDAQLTEAIAMLVGLLEAGKSVPQAMEQVVGASEDPFRSHVGQALQGMVATKSLVEALRPLSLRFPSQAFRDFLAALEMDEEIGGELEPALRYVGESLREEAARRDEARSQLAAARRNFYYLAVIIVGTCVAVVRNGGHSTWVALTSSPGIFVLLIAVANYAFGIWRCNRIFSSIGEEK